MKKTLLIAGALLALTASMASAQGGMNLSWTDCGTSGVSTLTYNCARNTGANTLFVSAVTPVPMPKLNGMAAVIDLQSNTATLSPWWDLSTTGCRGAAFSGSASFVAGPFSCLDAWNGHASGGMDYTYQFGALNRGRIRGVWAVPTPVSSDGTDEYYLEEVIITNAQTTGTGSCAGCSNGACIVLNSVQVTQPTGLGDYVIVNPLNSNFVTWQASGSNPGGGPFGQGCPGATPTHNNTWGSVKALYR